VPGLKEAKLHRHSRYLRKGRYSSSGNHYLLTTVTRDRQPFLANFIVARLLIHSLRAQQEAGRVSSLAFVVMPDHFHWLIELLCDDLAEVMRLVKGRSARLGNIYLDQTGSLWQNGYHDHALRRDEDLRVAARYLGTNLLRAGLVKTLNDYPHCYAAWL